jgi:hypothetical protein
VSPKSDVPSGGCKWSPAQAHSDKLPASVASEQNKKTGKFPQPSTKGNNFFIFSVIIMIAAFLSRGILGFTVEYCMILSSPSFDTVFHRSDATLHLYPLPSSFNLNQRNFYYILTVDSNVDPKGKININYWSISQHIG